MREERTDVLVVGAGPIGLWTALLLAEAGLEVTIIDREDRTAARSYACALHPATLQLLKAQNLVDGLLTEGRKVSKVGIYAQEARKAEISFSGLSKEFPFLLILPQNLLEAALEARLRERGVAVKWNHRFDTFENEGEEVCATIEQLAGTSTGYIVPHWEMVVKDRYQCRAHYLIGADGHNSLVRQRSGIPFELVEAPRSFAAYEFVTDAATGDELRIAMDESSMSVLWPVAENRFRWTFQIVQSDFQAEFPEKERRAVRVSHQDRDEQIRQYVERVAHKRAPWFAAPVKEITWCTQVAFAQQLVTTFGKNRCWLVGDAAHQTGPAGVQSMNAGFTEVSGLSKLLPAIVADDRPLESLNPLSQEQGAAWRKMLGRDGGLKPRNGTDPWIASRAARLLPCLPATGDGLKQLAGQLALDYP